jgi:HK97 gp10 family phage protein
MVRVRVQVVGLEALAATLERVRAAASPAMVKASLRLGAAPVAERARQLCRRGSGAPDLADHIIVRAGGTRVPSVAIGPSKEARPDRPGLTYDRQAWYLEYGTSRMPARAFLRPAMDGESAQAGAIATRALWEAVAKAGTSG